MKVNYHQEAGDIPLTLGTDEIAENKLTGRKAGTVKALRNEAGEVVVHEPVEGTKAGQYTPVFDPEAAKSKSQKDPAKDK